MVMYQDKEEHDKAKLMEEKINNIEKKLNR
jgi:hypothetical protein